MPISTIPAASAISGTLPAANAPSGSVIQVVQGTYSTYSNTSSSSYINSNITATITPKFSTSKILVLANMNGLYNSNIANGGIFASIYKNGSPLALIIQYAVYINTTLQQFGTVSGNYLDSPNTTSATTYAIYYKSASGTNVIFNNNNEVSSITLLEIAA